MKKVIKLAFSPVIVWSYINVYGFKKSINRAFDILTGGASKVYRTRYNEVKVDDNLILLDSFLGRMIGCNPYALYKGMANSSMFRQHKFIWVKNAGTGIPDDVMQDKRVSFVTYESKEYIEALLQAKYLIANTDFPPYFFKKNEQIYINPWHGTPIKCLGLDILDSKLIASVNTQHNFLHSDVIVGSSMYCTEKTVLAYGADLALDRVYEVGTPRIDLTLSTKKGEVRKKLGLIKDCRQKKDNSSYILSDEKKILLYAPTWRMENGKPSKEVQYIVDAILALNTKFEHEYEVFVSLHHQTAQLLHSKSLAFKQIPNDIPINVVLAGVDCLITDYSSIMVDYLCLDRPIVLYCPDVESYKNQQGFYIDLEDFPAELATNTNFLVSCVENARRPSMFKTYKKISKLLIPLEDGSATERVLDILSKKKKPSYQDVNKMRVLCCLGEAVSNKIIQSFIEFSQKNDYEKYELIVVIDACKFDKYPRWLDQLLKEKSEIKMILKGSSTVYTSKTIKVLAKLKKKTLSQADKILLERCFIDEASLIFSDIKFDFSIDYSERFSYWGLVMSKVNSRKKLVYRHNGVYSDDCSKNLVAFYDELPFVFDLSQEHNGVLALSPKNKNSNYEY